MSAGWFVVQTHPRGEERALINLGRQGFEAYLPKYLKRRRHARKVETVATPLYPRYLFVSAESALSRWRSIHSTFGVSRLLCRRDVPESVPDGVIAGLRRREEGGLVRLARRTYAAGERVRILDGVFADHLGLYEEMKDEERICVLLELLGRKVRIVVDELSVAAVA